MFNVIHLAIVDMFGHIVSVPNNSVLNCALSFSFLDRWQNNLLVDDFSLYRRCQRTGNCILPIYIKRHYISTNYVFINHHDYGYVH